MKNGLILLGAVATLFTITSFAHEDHDKTATALSHHQVKVKCLGVKGEKSDNKEGWVWVKAKDADAAEKACQEKGGKVMDEEQDKPEDKSKHK